MIIRFIRTGGDISGAIESIRKRTSLFFFFSPCCDWYIMCHRASAVEPARICVIVSPVVDNLYWKRIFYTVLAWETSGRAICSSWCVHLSKRFIHRCSRNENDSIFPWMIDLTYQCAHRSIYDALGLMPSWWVKGFSSVRLDDSFQYFCSHLGVRFWGGLGIGWEWPRHQRCPPQF